ncbi:MAG: hypothetical protein PVI17_00470, partial [Syntrophobacterales bacterium]
VKRDWVRGPLRGFPYSFPLAAVCCSDGVYKIPKLKHQTGAPPQFNNNVPERIAASIDIILLSLNF